MSEMMDRIMAAKLAERKRVVALPFEQKLTIMEQLRDRSFSIQNPTVVTVSGDALVLSASGARIAGLTPLADCQQQGQLHTRHNSVTLIAELRKQPARWLVERMQEPEPEFASPSQALLDFHQNL